MCCGPCGFLTRLRLEGISSSDVYTTMYRSECETHFFAVISRSGEELGFNRFAGLPTHREFGGRIQSNSSRFAARGSACRNLLIYLGLPQIADSADSSRPLGLHDA